MQDIKCLAVAGVEGFLSALAIVDTQHTLATQTVEMKIPKGLLAEVIEDSIGSYRLTTYGS